MDEYIVEEKKCPICNENIRSDANIHECCKLCSMGIPEPSVAPKLQTKNGIEYFCCDKCLKIYKEKIIHIIRNIDANVYYCRNIADLIFFNIY